MKKFAKTRFWILWKLFVNKNWSHYQKNFNENCNNWNQNQKKILFIANSKTSWVF